MWLSLKRRSALALIFIMLLAGPAMADVFQAAQYSLLPDDEEPLHYVFSAQIPAEAVTTAQPLWPAGCETLGRDRQAMGKRLILTYAFACSEEFAPDAKIRAPWPVDGATFYASINGKRIEQAYPSGVTGTLINVGNGAVPARAFAQAAGYYSWQGIVHIWMGWDHLAFVLCLCLVSRGRQLLVLVTAFTLGHSISLALAYLEIVRIPVPPVEAIIALSIALMAREALLSSQPETTAAPTAAKYAVIVSVFGLLHGLGFASALEGLGVSAGERVMGLIFFNIGVEIGQLIFVAVIAAAFAGLSSLSLAKSARIAAAWGAGVVGCFWTLERILGFPWGAVGA